MPYKVVVTIGFKEVPSPGSNALGLMLVAAFESAIAAAGVVPWKFVARQNVRAVNGSGGRMVSVSTQLQHHA